MKKILIAATSSGSGKTLLTCGMLHLLKKLNMNPMSYKCGPDYIDPMFHRKVLGINGSNLDSFFSSDKQLKEIVDRGAGDIAVIEGVMGIYDGLSVDSDEGSSYSVARAVGANIVLVIDAKGQGRTIIPVIKGILSEDSSKLIKGIILNRMSGYYYEKLKPVLEKELAKVRADVKVLGFVPKMEGINLDSRHLGLKMPDEIKDIKVQIETVAESIYTNCDVESLLKIAEDCNETSVNIKSITAKIGDKVDIKTDADQNEKMVDITFDAALYEKIVDITLAIARDEAFCFYYRDNISMLEEAGVKIKYFSPIEDKKLPDADGMLLGGGYPELHLEKLSKNSSMLKSIKEALDSGMPCLAECGGFMYLHEKIRDDLNQEYSMVGAIEGECYNTGHLVRFGYITLTDDASLESEHKSIYDGIKGHEFHYYDSTNNGETCMAVKPDKSKQWKCMISNGINYWGFPHLYYPSKPEFIYEFIENMIKWKAVKAKD